MAGTADEYGQYRKEKDKLKAAAAASVVQSLRNTNPEQKARATTVSTLLGVPDQIYESNPDHFDALLDQRFNQEILRRSPRTADVLLNDPRIAELGHDDIQNMSSMERAIRDVTKIGSAVISPFGLAYNELGVTDTAINEFKRTGIRMTAFPDSMSARMNFNVAKDIGRTEEQILKDVLLQMNTTAETATPQSYDLALRTAKERFEMAAQFDETDKAAMMQTSADALANVRSIMDRANEIPMPEAAQRFSDATEDATAGEFLTAMLDDPLGASAFFGVVGLQSVPTAGAAAAASAVGGPTAGAAVMFGGSFAQASTSEMMQFFSDMKVDLSTRETALAALQDPTIMEEAQRRGLEYGLVVAIFDAASFRVAGVTEQFIRNPAAKAVAELAIQGALGAAGEAAGQQASRGEVNWKDVITEGLAEFVTGPIEVAAGGRQWMKDRQRSRQAQSIKDAFTAMTSASSASKLRSRLPKAYGQFVDGMTRNGPVDTMYVPADKFTEYFQSVGADPQSVLSSLGLNAEEVKTAMETGGDLAIPTSKFSEVIAGSKHTPWFLDNMRVSPDQMTFVEAKEFEAKKDQLALEVKDEIARTQAEQQLLIETNAAILQRVKQQLIAGGMQADQAETNARVWPAFFTAMAERAGMGVDDLAEAIGLPRIEGPANLGQGTLTEDFGSVLDDLRSRAAQNAVPVGNNGEQQGEVAVPSGDLATPDAAGAAVPTGDMAGAASPPAAPADPARSSQLDAVAAYLDEIGATLDMSNEEIAALVEQDNTDSETRTLLQSDLENLMDEEADAPLDDGADVPEDIDAFATLDGANALSQGQSWQTGRDLKAAMQSRLLAAANVAGVDLSQRTAANVRYLVRVGLKDARIALAQNPNAIGWYDEKTRQALAVMALIHPEIATDENARFAFTWALAVTSNGLKVGKNFELADMVYRRYKIDGKMPSDLTAGQAQEAINNSLALFNELRDAWGMDTLRKFMQTTFTVKEISAIDKALKPSGEAASQVVRGSAILGPKIGNGFFSNLYGNFDALTMDRWLIRTWGRWTGTLLTPNQTNIDNSRTRLQAALQRVDAVALASTMMMVTTKQADRDRMLAAVSTGLQQLTDDPASAMDALAAAIGKASMEPRLREAMNAVAGGEELRKAGNALFKYNDAQKEAPSGPPERVYIREVFTGILNELKADPAYADLTMADLQAVLWYAEKRLYETAKEDASVADDDVAGYDDEEAPDYANAAAEVARADGVPEKKIRAALAKESKDGRAAAARRRDGEPQAVQGQQAAGGGFDRAERREFVQTRAIHRIRSARGGDAAAWSYGGGSAVDGGKARVLKGLGVSYIAEWKAGRSMATVFRANGMASPSFLELEGNAQNAARFAEAISAGRDTLGPVGKAVYIYPVEDYAGMRMFLTKDGSAGFAVKPDGDIVSVFSSAGSGAGRAIMEAAIAAGGRKLDAFHTILPSFYAVHGFRGAARLPWDDSQSPDGWDKAAMAKFNGGEPDVVLMAYDPDYFGGYDPKATPLKKGPSGYDSAVRAQKKLMGSVRGAGLTLNQGAANGQGRPEQSGDGAGRYAAGGLAPLAGAPTVEGASGPDARLVAVAEQYARDNGIPLTRQGEFVEVDPERAARIAAAYDAMPHAPQDPAVKEAYQNLIAQTLAQYRALEAAGYVFYFFDETNDPYAGNPWNAMRDLRANQRMAVFATEAGFGSGATELNVDDNPLLADTGIVWGYGSPDGEPKRVLANDLFRAVHDAFGHGLEGAGFRARGEENAWQAHVRLFTGSAIGALTSETRGQNSWLNFGPYGEKNQTAKVEDTVFADQKTGLMPSWTWEEGRAADEGLTLNQPAWHGSPHLFSKFSTQFMGTGEGAQAFGWGLYFAGRKSLAQYYRKKLSGEQNGYTTPTGTSTKDYDGIALGEMIADSIGTTYEQLVARFGDEAIVDDGITDVVSRIRYGEAFTGSGSTVELAIEEALQKAGWRQNPAAVFGGKEAVNARALADLYAQEIAKQIPSADFDPANERTGMSFAWYASVTLAEGLIDKQLSLSDALGAAKTDVKIYMTPQGEAQAAAVDRMFEILEALAKDTELKRAGRLYKVEIPDDSELLWWDEPLHKQPESVKAKLKAMTDVDWTEALFPHQIIDGFPRDMTGQQMYRWFSRTLFGSDKAASEALMAAGIAGHRFLDGQSRDAGEGSYNYVIYDDSAVEIAEFEQNMGGGPRGSITLPVNGLGKGEAVIRLFASSDLSTFMHESGHFFLSALQALAARPDVKPEVRQMYQTVKDWWRENADAVAKDAAKATGTPVTAADVIAALDNGTTGNRMVDIAINIGMQEQWARGYEAYLMEGKSPSRGLAVVFESMTRWLKLIYQALTGGDLDVKLSPEIRSVFDRMLATDAEIQEARAEMGDQELFESAEVAGMTPEEFAKLRQLHAEARALMMADLLEQTMAPIRRQTAAWWKAERSKVEDEIRKDVVQRPVYRAIMALRFGRGTNGEELVPPIKLSRDAIIASYGADIIPRLAGSTKDGKGHRFAVYAAGPEGLHPDTVAEMFGYPTGRELLDALVTSPPMEEVIQQETDARMTAKYGDPLNDGSIADKAIAALHTDPRAEALERELAALVRMAGEGDALTAKEARATAKAAIKAMRVKAAITPAAFLAAERRAAREAIRLARLVGKQGVVAGQAQRDARREAKGAVKAEEVENPLGMNQTFDRANAAVQSTTFQTKTKAGQTQATRKGYNDNLAALIAAKRSQLLNHMLYNEARQIEAKVDKVVARLAKIKSDKKASKTRDIQYVKAARAIAGKFGLAKPDSDFDFQMWLEQLQFEDPLALSAMTNAIVTYGQDAKPYTELTVDELQSVIDAVDSILEVGKALKKAEIDGKAMDRDAIIGELTQIAEARDKGRELGLTRRLTRGEKARMALLSTRAALVRVEAWARDMDDGKLGAFNRYLVKPVMDAVGRYRDDRNARLAQLLEVIDPAKKELLGKPINAPELGFTFENKGMLIHALLHTGNDSNFQKLLIGRGWSAGFVNKKQAMTAQGKPRFDKLGNPILDKGVLDTAKWDAFMARMFREGVITKADMDMVAKIWRLMDSTKRPAQAAHKKIFGYYFTEIQPRMVVTPFGTYEGGYVPAIVDKLASVDGDVRQAQAAVEATPATAMFPTTGNGFTKSRVENYREPLELNLMLLPSHMDRVIRFTHLEPVIRQTASIANDKGFRQAMAKVDPKIMQGMFTPWLQRVAQQIVETPPMSEAGRVMAKIFRTIRRRAGLHTMFANVVNTAQQVTGFSTAAILVGPMRLKAGMAQMIRHPQLTRENVLANSSFMRDRMTAQGRDISRLIEEAIVEPTKLGRMEDWFIRHGYFMQQAFQNVIDPIIWTAAYDKATAEGKAHDDAVFEADSVIRRTQGDMSPESVSLFESANAFTRMFTMFYSYFNAQANLIGGEMATALRTMGFAGASKRMAFIYIAGVAVPAIVSEMIVQAARGELGDEDDDGYLDDLLEMIIGSQARYVAAFIPAVGQLANTMVGAFTDQFYDDRLSVSPVISTVERGLGAPAAVVDAMGDSEKTGRAMGDVMTAIGMMIGVPMGQIAKTGGFLVDTATGKQEPEGPLGVAQGLVTGRAPAP